MEPAHIPLVCTPVHTGQNHQALGLCAAVCLPEWLSKSMMTFTRETLLRSWPTSRLDSHFGYIWTAEDPDRQSNLFKVIGLLTKNFWAPWLQIFWLKLHPFPLPLNLLSCFLKQYCSTHVWLGWLLLTVRCSEMVEINYQLKLTIVPLCLLAVKSIFGFKINAPALLTEIGLVGKQRKKVVKKKRRRSQECCRKWSWTK